MNIADIIILLLLGLAAYIGHRYGTIRQFCSFLGIIIGFLVAAFLYDKIAFLTQESGLRTLVLGGVLLGTTFLFFDLFMVAGSWAQKKWKNKYTGSLADKIISGLITAIGSLAVLWLLALTFATVFPAPVKTQIETSFIFSTVTRNPGVPKLFSSLSQMLKPFNAPDVFIGDEPKYTSGNINQTFEELDWAIEATKPSLAKITSWGCGSVNSSSGFLISKRHVVTNAHAIAGGERMSIQNQGATYVARPVLFDPRLDLAILLTENDLPGPPLSLDESPLAPGSVAAVLGFPQGGGLTSGDAIVLEQLQADGYDIYRQNKVERTVYALRSDVVPGNSGGPVIDSRGHVVAVVFGHSTNQPKIGYALSANQISGVVKNAQTLQAQVSAGLCTAN